MMEDGNVFEVEISSDFPKWRRFNVYLSVVGHDASGVRTSFTALADCFPMNTSHDPAADKNGLPRILKQESAPCEYAVLYFNVVTNTLPESNRVADSPDFWVMLALRCNRQPLGMIRCRVNQFGGFSRNGIEVTGKPLGKDIIFR